MDWRKRIYDSYVTSGSSKLSRDDIDATLTRKRRYLERICERYVPPMKGGRVVDFGCGFGAMLSVLKSRGYSQVEGVDVSPEMVETAHSIGVPEVQIGTIDGYLDSCEPESIDVAIFMDVLEHLTREELFVALDKVFRSMRPGGRLIAHVPNGQGIFGNTIRYGDLTHELAFTAQSARQVLTTVGFKNVQSFEEEIVVHGIVSAGRAFVWTVGKLWMRLLYMAETGNRNILLTSNMLIIADKA